MQNVYVPDWYANDKEVGELTSMASENNQSNYTTEYNVYEIHSSAE